MMRLSTRLSLVMFFVGCSCLAAQGQDSLSDLTWLAGGWQGIMGKAQIEEHWIQPAGGTMLAVSRTVANGRTVAFEFLRIESRADGTFYVAQPQGRPPVEFKLTQRSENRAVFENPQHDHPKIIRYSKDADGSLRAEIEGDEKGTHQKMEFKFQPVSQR
ncbi:MAG TPA: DUF6265 family protein [Terriglobia bacterium]|nr:DUF6265 family protein [Terriglobia bacterium]